MTAGTENRKRIINSIMYTCVVWTALIMFFILVPLRFAEPGKRSFETIQIRLPPAGTAAERNVQSAVRDMPAEAPPSAGPASAPEAERPASSAASQVSPAAEQSAVSRPAPAGAPRSDRGETSAGTIRESVPADTLSPAPQQLAPDFTSEFWAKNNAPAARPAPSPSEWPDDGNFREYSSPSSSSSAASSVSGTDGNGTALPAFEGSAAETGSDTGARSVSSAGRAQSGTVSGSTAAALSAVTRSYESAGAGGSTRSTVKVGTVPSAGGNGESLVMTDGTARRLLEPREPRITLSESSERLIDASKDLTISFTVLPEGNVSPGSIRFSPAGLLQSEVQNDIRAQISLWRFEPWPNDGQAEFQYSIKKE